VLRTSWVHDDTGPNFVVTMLRLLATRDEVRVVDDQLGRPTHADSVARAILAWSDRAPTPPVLHWSDGGVATWYDLASATWWLARERGLPLRSGPPVPIPSTDYPTRAPRPRNTVLCLRSSASALGLVPCHWLTTLAHSLPPGPR
jgi:dTDP-4-dehydrorhamnose reductase